MLVKDMFDKNGHNPSCGYAGDIVSYLYDEIDPSEKLKFESHLAGCHSCGTELAGFSNVRSSVNTWRTEEFGWLPTPQIVIPYEAIEESPVNVAETRGTILTDLKRIFSFTPWPPAFAAFGALAVLAGLAFFAVNYVNKEGVSVAENKNTVRPVAGPTVEAPKPSPEVAAGGDPPSPRVSDRTAPPVKNPEVVKISTNTQSTPKNPAPPRNEAGTSNKPGEKTTTPEKQKAPSLNNYTDDEDTTLRLADLFEEIDTRE